MENTDKGIKDKGKKSEHSGIEIKEFLKDYKKIEDTCGGSNKHIEYPKMKIKKWYSRVF